jgi:hypothetical protein
MHGDDDPAVSAFWSAFEDLLDALGGARVGFDRAHDKLREWLSALMPLGRQATPAGAVPQGGTLVVSADLPSVVSVCAALHGEQVTACNSVPLALRAIERGGAFDAVLCDASMAAVSILVRVAQQELPPRVAFLDTATSDPLALACLGSGGAPVMSPAAGERIRSFANGSNAAE